MEWPEVVVTYGGRVHVPNLRVLVAQERSATAIEYAMLGSLIAAVIALAVSMLGTKVLPLFQLAVNLFP